MLSGITLYMKTGIANGSMLQYINTQEHSPVTMYPDLFSLFSEW